MGVDLGSEVQTEIMATWTGSPPSTGGRINDNIRDYEAPGVGWGDVGAGRSMGNPQGRTANVAVDQTILQSFLQRI